MTTIERADATYRIYSEARDRLGLTDYAVAKKIGCRPSTISDWKRGVYTPKFDKLMKIAAAVEIPAESFCGQ